MPGIESTGSLSIASDSLNHFGDVWLQWMIAMSWNVTWLVAVLLLLQILLRSYSAQLKHLLWLLVLVRLVVPPTWAFPTGIAWWVKAPAETMSSISQAEATNNVVPRITVDQAVPAQLSEKPAQPQPVATASWSMILMMIWIGIVLCWFCLHLWARARIGRWIRAASEIDDAVILETLETARQRAAVSQRIAIKNSQHCSTPLVAGYFRPVILLPSYVLDSMSRQEIESILVHELTHIRRHDGLVRQVQGLLGAIYFFHPLVWIANRLIRRTREDACDEQTVAALGGHRKAYAEAIVKSAASLGYEPPEMALGMLDPSYPIKQRLLRILDPHLPTHSRGTAVRVAFVGCAALIMLPSGAKPLAESHARSATAPAENSDGSQRMSVAVPTARAVAPAPTDELTTVDGATVVSDDPVEIEAERSEEIATRSSEPASSMLESNSPDQIAAQGDEGHWLRMLQDPDRAKRMEAYAQLQLSQSEEVYEALMLAFLKRGGSEQSAAKSALDAVGSRLKYEQSRSPTRAVRIHAVAGESELDYGF